MYEVDTTEFLNSAVPTVVFYQELSESISYCLYEVDDGVCHMTFVATQKNKRKFRRFKIGSEFDEDFAVPQYSTTSFEHNPAKRSITITTDIQKAKEKYLTVDGGQKVFRQGYDMENVETINYSLKKTIAIDLSGNIQIKNVH